MAYDGGFFGGEICLKAVLFVELLAALGGRKDNDVGIGVAYHQILPLEDSQVLQDMIARKHRIGGLGRDGAMVYFLHGERGTISLGMPVLPPPPPAK